ncbi:MULTISPECIES: hypothetical protein [unclassified Brevibacterium]|uniref:hypothetical protein n=1 Tax=unclassified Brevibacterium TaxID=2614124 RepID=UPI0010805FD0|nr:hypothetical protein [Brevibacterium sp. S111]
MGRSELWITLWETVEDKPEDMFGLALNRIMPQALAKTRAASPSARISGFSGVKHRTYSAFAAASMHRHAQTRQQPVDKLWESLVGLWREGGSYAVESVDKPSISRCQHHFEAVSDRRGGCGRPDRGRKNRDTQETHKLGSGDGDLPAMSVPFPMMVQ